MITGNERALRSFIHCTLENTNTRVKRAAYRLNETSLLLKGWFH